MVVHFGIWGHFLTLQESFKQPPADPCTSELSSSHAKGKASLPSACLRSRVLGCHGEGAGDPSLSSSTVPTRALSSPKQQQESEVLPPSCSGSSKWDLGTAPKPGDSLLLPLPSANSRLTIYLTCCGRVVPALTPLIRGNECCSVQ